MTNDNRQIWRRWLAAAMAVSIGFLAAVLSPVSHAKPEVVMFYGDSLTAAYGLSPDQGYPALIEHKIKDAGLAGNYVAQASAVSGETSAGGVNRIQWALAGLKRSKQDLGVFVLALGANDGLRGLPVDAMEKNLQTIIDRVRQEYPDVQLVVVGMLMPPNLGDDYRARFAAAFGEVAKANEAHLIPFLLEGVAGNPELNLPDGIHPNPEGQKIIADKLWPELEPLLTKDNTTKL